jgi:external thioesterase TEII
MSKLLFIPHAGGNSNSFNFLKDKPEYNFIGLDYAGHAGRDKKPLLYSINEIVEDLYNHYKDEFNDEYCLFGYSMGGIVAYELYKKLQKENTRLPRKIFLGASPSPDSVAQRKNKISVLPDEQFIQEIISYNGISKELLRFNDLIRFLTPVIKADYYAYEHYIQEEPTIIDVPLYAFMGTDDFIEMKDIMKWQHFTRSTFEFKVYNGDHFFIFNHTEDVRKTIGLEIKAEEETIINAYKNQYK